MTFNGCKSHPIMSLHVLTDFLAHGAACNVSSMQKGVSESRPLNGGVHSEQHGSSTHNLNRVTPTDLCLVVGSWSEVKESELL